jgi:hypothetical protein
MDAMQPGLRYRIRRAIRQMGEQHAHLRACFTEIRMALARGDTSGCQDALERLRSVLEAHFELEDDVFFPALHGLRPDCAEGLERLSREHVGFADALRRLAKDLEDAGVDACERAFEAFAGSIAEHEAHEERLVGSIAGPESESD